ncbi:MAG TPA: hypothetical protein VHC68_03125 [Candidatus Paceibacterota bacterium]|nr:hypothetical protein [Candidatus Paceibacterota bacterium]
MGPLVFLLAALALVAGFFALTSWETARGGRLFAPARARFDERVARAAFVARHVDWGSYFASESRVLLLRLGHDLAHLSLRFVRFVERVLARTLRSLRARVAHEAPAGEPTRPFVQALSDFKEELKTARPEDLGNPPE